MCLIDDVGGAVVASETTVTNVYGGRSYRRRVPHRLHRGSRPVRHRHVTFSDAGRGGGDIRGPSAKVDQPLTLHQHAASDILVSLRVIRCLTVCL